MQSASKPGAPLQIHVATAEDIATLHGYDQVIIYARKPGNPGAEWVTTWGSDEPNKQAAAQIGAAIRHGVTPQLERMRGLLTEVVALLPRLMLRRKDIVSRIEACLKPIELEKPTESKKP